MAKPRLILLVRHAQSEGNKHREIHQTIPDHRVKLTPDGWLQAYDAGRRLREMLRPDDTLHFFTSPYRRTRETTEGILATLTSDEPEPSPFRRSNIKVYEEPRLREQDFGNFQPCSAEMERMWQERSDYGHFFYRIPNGESAADAYDRISGFNESLWRQFGEDDFASVCVLVTHGLMSRVFLMKWYHFTVEYFEDLCNVNHCEFLIMRKQESGRYLLENKLRTWSEVRRQRALANKEKSKDGDKENGKEIVKLERTKSIVVQRRWGGCPNGCSHTSPFKTPEHVEILRQQEAERSALASQLPGSLPVSIATRRQKQHPHCHRHALPGHSEDDEDIDKSTAGPKIDVKRTMEELVSSPDGTPSFINASDRLQSIKSPHLHLTREGPHSGRTSIAGSDTDASEDEIAQRRKQFASLSIHGHGLRKSSVDSNAKAYDEFDNRLGDAPPRIGVDLDGEPDSGDIDKAEKEDRSILGSVY
ncbi:hypothetical protein S40285_01992 [Stachybotrys chlorohalonatus IBT 40285]|uniref:Uncharacterized protein n=1 Tax=Stachybotrys chlorohalonatus (strain IBT 40285) TaxID=1283841 RepID=A0A084QIJ4_STAC4|nr:hypothetical protein S40285_01992 [Stachybotrys chlorohalonata IBT 40285]